MKARNFSFVLLITIFLSGCVVYSFYPLYTEKDLFSNDILTGNWVDLDEDTEWSFKHPYIGKKENGILDSTSYYLELITKDGDEILRSEFSVHVIELGGHYFLDFYLKEFPTDEGLDLSSFHLIPVHTFAKLSLKEDELQINWFDQEWLGELIKENKIRIHHENNDDFILLTAKPRELQKFVTKYVNSNEAFENGLDATLTKK